MNQKTIYTFPVSDSITNGKFFVINIVAGRMRMYLKENLFGRNKSTGISFLLDEIVFLLGIRFGLTLLNIPLKVNARPNRELCAAKFMKDNIEMVRITQTKNGLSNSIDIPLQDYFRKLQPFLHNYKNLLE